jgi:hypothetical protein
MANIIHVNRSTGDITLPEFTSGSMLYIDSSNVLQEDNSKLFWDATNKRLGLGTTSPEVEVELHEPAARNPTIMIKGSVYTPFFVGRKSAGTKAVPAATAADATLFGLGGSGHTGSGWEANSKAQIKFQASETWSVGNEGTYISFHTTDDGTTTLDERVRIIHDGSVGINETSPQARLDVNGASRFGDSTTNYLGVGTNGDVSFTGTAGFYPVRIAQSVQPTPDTGELIVWRDTDDGKVYLVYNDTDSGVKQVEMT